MRFFTTSPSIPNLLPVRRVADQVVFFAVRVCHSTLSCRISWVDLACFRKKMTTKRIEHSFDENFHRDDDLCK